MSAIEIARQDLSISQLRAEAARTADAKQARRILAIAMVCWMVIRGCWPRRPVPWTGRRYATVCIATNADGLAGWRTAPALASASSGRKPQRSEVAKWVEDGPDLKTDGVVRWRCADLRDELPPNSCSSAFERSVASAEKKSKKLNFSSMSVRPVHPQSDLRHRSF